MGYSPWVTKSQIQMIMHTHTFSLGIFKLLRIAFDFLVSNIYMKTDSTFLLNLYTT